jgi:site-specific DNA-methyltransferase (adenine-specific)
LAAAASFAEENAFHKLFHASSYETDITNLFDVIVTDPPYGIDIHKKETFDADSHEYDDSDEAFQEVLQKLPSLAYRTSKDDAHIYVFCDIRRFSELFIAFELAGWTCWAKPVIWDKGTTGSYGNIEYGFRACYDAILFARKGDKKVTAGFRDVININQQTGHAHPAGKPITLYTELLKRSVYPGDTVADFYCGGGPIFAAATELQCVAYGWEINDKYHALAFEARAKEEGK